ncbi:MAG: hypothetical protein PVH21_13735 [Myxococcales bacterium]
MPTRAAVICCWVLSLAVPHALRADAGERLEAGERAPKHREGSFAVGPETGLVVPLSTKRLCPAGYECIADVGWAVGVDFSYRWDNGLGVGFGYEFWLLSANGVYEITVPQMFLGSLEYSFLPDRATHPLIRARGGLLTLGPSFRVATVGGAAELGAGAEVELTPTTLISFLLTGNLVRTHSFTTPGDGALRAADHVLDAMLVLRIGFRFLL